MNDSQSSGRDQEELHDQARCVGERVMADGFTVEDFWCL